MEDSQIEVPIGKKILFIDYCLSFNIFCLDFLWFKRENKKSPFGRYFNNCKYIMVGDRGLEPLTFTTSM